MKKSLRPRNKAKLSEPLNYQLSLYALSACAAGLSGRAGRDRTSASSKQAARKTLCRDRGFMLNTGRREATPKDSDGSILPVGCSIMGSG